MKFQGLDLVCQYFLDFDHKGNGVYYYILGVFKDGEFKDFYYSSGIDYETYQKAIPTGFVEIMESVYESKKSLAESLEILRNAGYTCHKSYSPFE